MRVKGADECVCGVGKCLAETLPKLVKLQYLHMWRAPILRIQLAARTLEPSLHIQDG